MSELCQISGCEDPERKADVIFVHGLGGDVYKTWRYGRDESTSWPHWLGKEFQEIGVWSLGYAASPTRLHRFLSFFNKRWREAGQSMALPDRALQVLDLMVQHGLGQRPILFVGHSLGGLLVKQVLRKALDSNDPLMKAVATQSRVVVFLATPHSGSNWATFLDTFKGVVGATVNIEELRSNHAQLRDLYDWYRNKAQDLGISTATYYEGRPINGLIIVNPSSSHPGTGSDPVPLDVNHLEIAKPQDVEDQVYRGVKMLLQQKILCLQPQTLPEEANNPPQKLRVDALLSPGSIAISISDLAELSAITSGTTQKELKEKRELWRQGLPKEAFEWVRSVHSSPVRWQSLSDEAKARLLRFEAGLELDVCQDIEKASALADEASEICPGQDETRIRAIIAHRRSGPAEALSIAVLSESIEALTLQAGLYIEIGDFDSAKRAIDQIPNIKESAETLRLKAIVSLLEKQFDKALLAIGRALEIAPKWESIRMTAGMVDYYSAISPIACPSMLPPSPTPVPPSYAKSDSQSIGRLKRALANFESLITEVQLKPEERDNLDGWRVACLMLLPGRQDDALQLCKAVLERRPQNMAVIFWCAALDLGIDLEGSEKALEEAAACDDASLGCFVSLMACYLTKGRSKKAVKRLKEVRRLFEKKGQLHTWQSWYVQAALRAGDNEALNEIDLTGDDPSVLYLRTMVLARSCAETGDWTPQAKHLKHSYEKTGNGEFLLGLCQTLAQIKEWADLADRSEELVERVGTVEAVRLAATSCYNAKRYKDCIRLINCNESAFPQKIIPVELRHLRTHCHTLLGAIPEAIRAANSVVDADPSTINLLMLVKAHVNIGDLRSAALVARKILRQPDLEAEDALGCANVILVEDTTLSIAFWRIAISGDLPDRAVGVAADIGWRLGLEEEMSPLITRMGALGAEGQGGIQLVSFDDIITWVSEHRQQVENLTKFYAEGKIPIHLICGHLGRPLHEFYHRLLKSNENSPDPINQASLYVRFGGGKNARGFGSEVSEWKLHADVTSILLAAHFDLLEQIEQVFRPIRISPSLTHSLRDMQLKSTPHQPSHLNASRLILKLLGNGKIHTVFGPKTYKVSGPNHLLGPERENLLCMARSNSGYVVDFHPLRESGNVKEIKDLPQEVASRFVSCRAVLESMRYGPLSNTKLKSAIASMGAQDSEPLYGTIPKVNRPLYFCMNTVHILASAEVLPLVCDYFEVYIQEEYRLHLVGETCGADENFKDKQWLSQLIEHVREGIDSGSYEVMAVSPRTGTDSDTPLPNEVNLNNIQDLMSFGAVKGDVIWSDDRFVTSHQRCNNIPIVGLPEVLQAMVEIGQLAECVYYRLLGRFRASNLRFIDFESGEINYLLSEAIVQNGRVCETRELQVLKQYVAACIHQAEVLCPPNPSKMAVNRFGEGSLLLNLSHAVSEALTSLWKDLNLSNEIRLGRAQWIISNLFSDYVGMFTHFRRESSSDDDRYLVATSLALLLIKGIQIIEKTEAFNARKSYLYLIYDNLIAPRVQADPEILAVIADIVRKGLPAMLDDTHGDTKGAALFIIQGFLGDLPEALQDEINRDRVVLEKMGLTYAETITIEGFRFVSDEFWAAVNDALNGRGNEIKCVGGNKPILFRQIKKGTNTYVAFNHPDNQKLMTFSMPEIPVLVDSYAKREEVLRQNQNWFDCTGKLADQRIAKICSTDDPQQRIELLRQEQRSSMQLFYVKLSEKIKTTESITFDRLMPSCLNSLLEHLRLDSPEESNISFSVRLESVAKTLLAEVGVQESLRRLAAFPVNLSPSVISALANLSVEDRRTVIRTSIQEFRSPLSRVHLMFVLISFASDTHAYMRLACCIGKWLASEEGMRQYQAFNKVISWIDAEISLRKESTSYSSATLLAIMWVHADRLFRIFSSLGVDSDWINEEFAKHINPVFSSWFGDRLSRLCDVASPDFLNVESFVLHGLAYSLGSSNMSVLPSGLSMVLLDIAFSKEGEKRHPSFFMMHDPVQARNNLDSFLGLDNGGVTNILFGPDLKPLVSSENLHNKVKQALCELDSDPKSFLSWVTLVATLGTSFPYEDILPQVQTLVLSCDLTNIITQDFKTGMLALQFISHQLRNFPCEKARTHIRNELKRIAKYMASTAELHTNKNEKNLDPSNVQGLLIAGAVMVATTGKNEQIAHDYAEMLKELWDIWEGMGLYYKNMIPHLVQELPINQGKEFYDLLFLLRARAV